MNRGVRNLVIFGVVTLGCGFAGRGFDNLIPPAEPMQGLGVLLWLVSPMLAGVLLRALGGDGWKDSGIGLNLQRSWIWYGTALLIPLSITFIVLLIALAFGQAAIPDFSSASLVSFTAMAGGAFVSVMVKNIFEEFSWRGYLSPRLETLGAHPFTNAILTGFIWAAWHIPYYLFYLDQTELAKHTSMNALGVSSLAFLILPFHALAYGEIRQLSQSTWTAWLLHNTANAVGLSLVSGGFVMVSKDLGGIIFSPGTEGILYSLLMGLVGLGLYFYRKQKGYKRL